MTKNPRMIHETYLKDIIDMLTDLKDWTAFKGDNNSGKPMYSKSSISNASSNLVAVFPVLCTKNISINTASMISKAVEKNCVTMLQRLFACFQISDANNTEEFLKAFHVNLSGKAASLDDIFRITSLGEASITYQDRDIVKQDMNNLDFYLSESINNYSLKDFVVNEGAVSLPPSYNTKRVENDDWKDVKNASDYFKNQVMNGDYKKANELMPTMIQVNFKHRNGDELVDLNPSIIGVKAKLYPMSSEDIIRHLTDKSYESNWITNFIRATTREISFIKDFIMAIDKAKIDAMSLSMRNSSSDKMWKVLERRALISKFKKIFRSNNNAAAITTLVVSQEEVEYMRKFAHIDLERIPVIRNLFEGLNFMSICIVDEALEIAKFIFDEEDPSWETLSFNHLEREASDQTYKKVVNLMTKMK